MKHKNEYKNTQQVQLEPYEQLNMEQYTQYTDNITVTWKTKTEYLNMSKTETEYLNMCSGLAHELTVLTELYRSSHSGQSLTGPTRKVSHRTSPQADSSHQTLSE